MASRWSSQFNVTEHKDLQATAMAMDRNGEFILLAGKRHVAIKNLNDVSDSLKKFPRNSKHDVGTAEWNPSAYNGHLCSIASNQKVEIFSCREGILDLYHTLKYHTRLVCDINWHRFDPNLLASSSLDSFTHVWDLRDPRKPALSYSAIANVHQVRWNKLTTHLLATAHDGDIRIWDQRKGSAPIQYISAHSAKIHGLDWSQTHEYQLASCSQDGTVKFFDVTHPKCPESLIQTASPIWRARYTPFGEGLVTVVISVSQRSENGLLLWNLSNQSMPVHTFVGHTNVVLEFEWRKNRTELSDYQLITWSKDQSLRIWKIEPFIQKLCGHDLEVESVGLAETLQPELRNKTSAGGFQSQAKKFDSNEAVVPAVEAVNEISFSNFDYFQNPEKYSFSPQDPFKSLELEFSLLACNLNLPNVKFDEMNVFNRLCIVTVSVNSYKLTLQITFPLSYPTNAAPSFQIDDSSSVDDHLRSKILKTLKQTAQQRVKKNRICLESCLTQLIATLEHSVQLQEIEVKPDLRLPVKGNGDSSFLPINSYFYETLNEVHVPFPKTCGARFCSVDKLVCFYRPALSRNKPGGHNSFTPRSFVTAAGNMILSSAPQSNVYLLSSPRQEVNNDAVSFFGQERNLNRPPNGNFHISGKSLTKSLKNVTIYDCSKLFLTQKELGERYTFDTQNIELMCNENAEAAANVGRLDLVQVWRLASLIAAATFRRNDAEEDTLWSNHPFFKAQIESLILHYAQISDIQTAAMLSCAFTSKSQPKILTSNKNVNNKSPGGSPYHTIHPADTNLEGWNFPSPKHNRSNSWSESLDDLKAIANILEHKEIVDATSEKNKVLDAKNSCMYDEFRRKYADVLHRWGLLEARTQMTKFLYFPKDSLSAIEFLLECHQCKKQILRPPYCSFCKKIALRCSVCRILVRGSSNFCFLCGHGGHTKHMMAWFKAESTCPTGCGCQCVSDVTAVFDS